MPPGKSPIDLDSYDRGLWWGDQARASAVYRLTKPGSPTLFLKTGIGLRAEVEQSDAADAILRHIADVLAAASVEVP